MAVRGRRMLVAVFAMLVRRSCVVLGLLVIAMGVVMRRLEMMVSGGIVMSGRLVMMLVCRMLVRHVAFLLIGRQRDAARAAMILASRAT